MYGFSMKVQRDNFLLTDRKIKQPLISIWSININIIS